MGVDGVEPPQTQWSSRLQRGGLAKDAQHPRMIGRHATCCCIELLFGHHDRTPRTTEGHRGFPGRPSFSYGVGLGRPMYPPPAWQSGSGRWGVQIRNRNGGLQLPDSRHTTTPKPYGLCASLVGVSLKKSSPLPCSLTTALPQTHKSNKKFTPICSCAVTPRKGST